MTATITRRAGRPRNEDILDLWQPSDRWCDPEVVQRALQGKTLEQLGLCGRKLTEAECLAIIGPVLDGVHQAILGGYPPVNPVTTLAKRLRWSGSVVARLTKAARPEHAERIRAARAGYRSWEAIHIGRERAHIKNGGVRSTRSAASRKAVKRAFVGKTGKASVAA